MKLTVKILSVLVLLALASPVILLKGCGNILTGGACGGCPNSTAPAGSTVTATTLTGYTMPYNGQVCYSNTTFQFFGSDGKPLNDICVEIYTNEANSSFALHNAPISCFSHPLSDFMTYLRTRTDSTGTVSLDFLVYDACNGLASGTSSVPVWIEARSCTTSGMSTATITLSPTCP